jgi:hypothetical protein
MCWPDNEYVRMAYYAAVLLLILVILWYVSSENFGEFKSALGNQDNWAHLSSSERFSVTDWEKSNFGTMLANFSTSGATEHLRCPQNVDPLESQFMSKMNFLTARNPCKN